MDDQLPVVAAFGEDDSGTDRRQRGGKRGEVTPKQKRFAEEYLIDLNAAQAARRAGYSGRSAAQAGRRLLQCPEIAKAVRSAMADRSERTAVTAERVLDELACIAFSDLRDLAGWGPEGVKPRPSSELADQAARALAEVTETSARGGGAVRLKLHDKKAALEALARHLGMQAERKTSGTAQDLVRRLEAGRQRAAARHAAAPARKTQDR